MAEILEQPKPLGGRRRGAGRHPRFRAGTWWPGVVVPADFAAGFVGADGRPDKEILMAWMRARALADGRPWDSAPPSPTTGAPDV